MHPVVLISGWAIPSSCLKFLETALQEHTTTTTVPLPGIDGVDINPITLQALTDYLHKKIPTLPAVLIGWSFGGTLAIHYATQYPQKVAGIITLATNPSFLQNTNNPYGIRPSEFENFCNLFYLQPRKVLKTFAMTCSNKNHDEMKLLQESWRHSSLVPNTLQALQKLLGYADVMPQLSQIRCPIAHCFGTADQLVPVETHKTIIEKLPHHLITIVPGSHMFFINKPQIVIKELFRLCTNIRLGS